MDVITHRWWDLTHWDRVTHICVGKLIIIDSDYGLSPDQHRALIWTTAGSLSIGPLWTYFRDNLIKIQFSLKKMHAMMSLWLLVNKTFADVWFDGFGVTSGIHCKPSVTVYVLHRGHRAMWYQQCGTSNWWKLFQDVLYISDFNFVISQNLSWNCRTIFSKYWSFLVFLLYLLLKTVHSTFEEETYRVLPVLMGVYIIQWYMTYRE